MYARVGISAALIVAAAPIFACGGGGGGAVRPTIQPTATLDSPGIRVLATPNSDKEIFNANKYYAKQTQDANQKWIVRETENAQDALLYGKDH